MIKVDKAIKSIESFKNRGIDYTDYGDLFSTLLADNNATPMEVIETINALNSFLYVRVNQLYTSAKVSKEHAMYLKKYLSGELYKEQSKPDEFMNIQNLNANRIYDEANFALHEG